MRLRKARCRAAMRLALALLLGTLLAALLWLGVRVLILVLTRD